MSEETVPVVCVTYSPCNLKEMIAASGDADTKNMMIFNSFISYFELQGNSNITDRTDVVRAEFKYKF